jgi:glycosyltransferase involved in cell wall biosynthesis
MAPRFLWIAREFTPGGAAYLALRHLQRMPEPVPVDLLVTGQVSPELRSQLPQHVTLHDTGWTAEFHALSVLDLREAILDSCHACMTETYDAALGTSLFADPAACTAYCLCRARSKSLCLVDEVLIHSGVPDEVRSAMRSAVVASDRVFSVSKGLLGMLAASEPALGGIPFEVIPPPITGRAPTDVPSPYGGVDPGALPRVITVARLSSEKRIDLCVRVHRALRDRGIDFMWHVVGDGAQRSKLERTIRRAQMQDRFRLEGPCTDPRPWFRHASLSVLLSRSEGCPTVIREALAEGTPVLSTDVNGARELIDDGITGAVVPDSEARITATLGALIQSPHELTRMRMAADALPTPDHRADTARLVASMMHEPRRRSAPAVSILIPTFNQARFIRRAVQSALMQDFSSLEVVVCDDESTDGTTDIVRELLHDPRLRLRVNDRNVGRVGNYRTALEQDARGSWVLMLDGDDHLANPSFIRLAVDALDAHSGRNPVFVQAGHRVIQDAIRDGRPAGTVPVDVLPEIPVDSQAMTGGEYLHFVYRTGFFTHLGTLYSRDAALRQGFYGRDISSSDMDSLLRLALSGNVVVLKSIAGCWVHHGGNTSSSLPLDRIEENVRIFREIAREGAAAGTIDMPSLERSLTRYEARTLIHLFGCSLAATSGGLTDSLRMMRIMARINPRVCLEPDLLRAWRRYTYRLTKMSLRSWKAKLRTLPGAGAPWVRE